MNSETLDRVINAIRYRIAFVGVRRLVAGAIGTVVCVAVAWFVLRPTPTPVELVLPRATVSPASQPVGTHTDTTQVVVHVTGAVVRPGVYSIPASSRIVDALEAAGGAIAGADLERINLAQTVTDAEQIHIPRRASSRPRATVAPRLRPRPSPTVTTVAVRKLVNINTATAAQLETLTGVGPSLAKSIITHRSQKGPFTRVDDLLNVPGIGPSKLSAMRDEVTVT